MKKIRLLAAGAVFASLCLAVQTRTWIQSTYEDFDKGHLDGLSLRSDGLLTLAPESKEIFDSSTTYLWALARDSKGNLYTGGGPGAKLFRIDSKGQTKTLAEFEGLLVQAIAIDRRDRVFAATSPDGRVYRVSDNGKTEVFYDPKAKYIWALAFNSRGDLFVATGDEGEIHRVSSDGKGSVFFRTEETHARSLAVDPKDNIIVGTEPGGLVLRVSPSAEGFVLYQMPKKEVTAVAVARDGSIYAAAVGLKQAKPPMPPVTQTPAAPGPGAAPAIQQPAQPAQQRQAAPPPPTLAPTGPAAVTGGSEVYRIDPSGNPRQVWEDTREIVYALAFDSTGRPLLGTGNKGYVYRIDSDRLDTALLNVPPTQITALSVGSDGRIYAVTGNVGKVYQFGPGLKQQGSIESDVFDAGNFSQWGRLTMKGVPNGGEISLSTRSGNLDRPQQNWSPWSDPVKSSEGGRVGSPSARFIQWKATLKAAPNGHAPELREIEVAYLPKNIPPRIDQIEATPPNYRFPPQPASLPAAQNITLPPIGKKSRSTPPSISADSGASMQYAKGWAGLRWSAADDNNDPLSFTVHIRGVGESEWKLLREDVRTRHLSWDSTAFADGEYVVRVTASDLPGNPPEAALTAEMVSEPFRIDNTPPEIEGLTAARKNSAVEVRWRAIDAGSNIDRAEYSLDGGDWIIVPPRTGLSDARELEYALRLDDVAPGERTIAVRVRDAFDNVTTRQVVVR